MSKVLVNETSLSGIADAIREKNGETTTYKPSEMAAAISAITTGGGGDIEVEPVVLSGQCNYLCSGKMASQYIDLFGDTVSTSGISSANYMFNNSTLTEIPFSLNFTGSMNTLDSLFNTCYYLTSIPEMNNVQPNSMGYLFYYCQNLTEIPEDICENWDWSYLQGQTSQYSGSQSNMFYQCASLRKAPLAFMKYGNPVISTTYCIYYGGFNGCYVLDEVVNLPFPHYNVFWTGNGFVGTVSECHRLKDFTFALQEDGSPYVMKWKSQTIDLSSYVGYTVSFQKSRILNHNSGITADKEVKDDATYQALKNDPDWFSCDVNYSRYNHDSAVNTINSLPDCSSSGGTNTIKFTGAAGALTDGGAINTLTEEEIAVATAKGWTVSLV